MSAFLKDLIKVFNFVKYLFSVNEKKNLIHSEVLFICGDSSRTILIENKRYSHLVDTLNEKLFSLNINTLTIASPPAIIFGDDAFGNVHSINGLYFRARLVKNIYSKLLRNSQAGNAIMGGMWANILSKVRPKLIIGIQPEIELCLIAKNKNIPIFDLQHGILSDEGYYGLQCRERINQEGWPTSILCWDQNSKNWVDKNCKNFVSSTVIGNPWLNRFLNKSENDTVVNSFSNIESIKLTENGKFSILITLQWGAEEQNIQGAILGMPQQLVQIVKETSNIYNWFIRIHPIQILNLGKGEIFENLCRSFNGFYNINWDWATDMPLPIVLSKMQLHLTSHSACTIEASYFNIKTGLFNSNSKMLYDYFSNQIKEGNAEIVELSTLNDWIKKNFEDLNTQIVNKGSEFENFLDLVISIVRKN
ncbi:hypothetical protein U0R10_06815 [Aquirufa sp. OSTEICH-129V]|uniref:Uncharacterized protein n=1 Tax=Aquirufa avitistagni TaxID=3104728 RepID=A0ABW6DBN9_9BACT